MRLPTIPILVALALTFAIPVSAGGVPNSALQLDVVRRDGETFLVVLNNPSDSVVSFDAVGLYFVPDPTKNDESPQRLGVVTPGQIATSGTEWKDAGSVLQLAPHQSILVKLASYCLDSQRRSPSEQTQYHLASTRMPSQLKDELARVAWTISNLGFDPETTSGVQPVQHPTPAATSALTQQAVWRIRQASKVSLAGETRDAQ